MEIRRVQVKNLLQIKKKILMLWQVPQQLGIKVTQSTQQHSCFVSISAEKKNQTKVAKSHVCLSLSTYLSIYIKIWRII